MVYCTRDVDFNKLQNKYLLEYKPSGSQDKLIYPDYTLLRVKRGVGYYFFLTDIKKDLQLPSTFINVKSCKPRNFYNLVIEGGDFAGKSTLLSSLLEYSIFCKDRDLIHISRYMLDIYSDKARFNIIGRFIKNSSTTKFIFMYITDTKELNRRMKTREVLDELDEDALKYNLMYCRLCNYLKSQNLQNVFIIKDNKFIMEDLIKFCLGES